MDLGLQGKVALVSGASKGLGFGVARALAAEGAKVSICSRDEAGISAAAARLREETGAEVLPVVCDVTKAQDIQNWIESSVAALGRIDALLVNAGGPPGGLFKDTTEAQWQAAFELTLLSAVRMVRAALPHLNQGSAILTITSSSIKEPIERLGLSTVMRSGVAGLVKTLADELAGDGIRVNNLIPGRIDTDRVAQLDAAAAQRSGKSVEQVRAESIAKIPLKRLGTIDDFGTAAAYLLSPAAAYVTGATLRVDGGMMRSI
ncbi:MAG: SDR family oxidoreductase [Chloroflexi bacterium]|nr:SDR family oxidoreductase [Chloroflexota bacterium]